MWGSFIRFVLIVAAITATGVYEGRAGQNVAAAWGTVVENSFSQVGLASYYSATGPTASGQQGAPDKLTAAHRSLPFGSRVKVTALKSGREVIVVINDRGPFRPGRIIDVSTKAARALGFMDQGITRVRITRLD